MSFKIGFSAEPERNQNYPDITTPTLKTTSATKITCNALTSNRLYHRNNCISTDAHFILFTKWNISSGPSFGSCSSLSGIECED